MTMGEFPTKRSLNRLASCITSHTGIMGITTFSVGKGVAVCLSSHTQAAVVGITDPKQPPKSLLAFLKDPHRLWITVDDWDSPFREVIGEERVLQVSSLNPQWKAEESVTKILHLLRWKHIRELEDREKIWKDFSPEKEDIQWISYLS